MSAITKAARAYIVAAFGPGFADPGTQDRARADLLAHRAGTIQEIAARCEVLCQEIRAGMAMDAGDREVWLYLLAEAIKDEVEGMG